MSFYNPPVTHFWPNKPVLKTHTRLSLLCTQWAAVRTQLLAISDPPQEICLARSSATWYGNWPGLAEKPPTIRALEPNSSGLMLSPPRIMGNKNPAKIHPKWVSTITNGENISPARWKEEWKILRGWWKWLEVSSCLTRAIRWSNQLNDEPMWNVN